VQNEVAPPLVGLRAGPRVRCEGTPIERAREAPRLAPTTPADVGLGGHVGWYSAGGAFIYTARPAKLRGAQV
jgi:hypothetical protein